MNPIDQLLDEGFAEDVRAAMAPGTTVHVGPLGDLGEIGPAMRACLDRLQAAGAGLEGRLGAFFGVSSDGERMMGEILLRPADGMPRVVWEVGRGSRRKLLLDRSRTATFGSFVDLAETKMNPERVMHAVDGAIADRVIATVAGLGYGIHWNAADTLSQQVHEFELRKAA